MEKQESPHVRQGDPVLTNYQAWCGLILIMLMGHVCCPLLGRVSDAGLLHLIRVKQSLNSS
jgi:hypothetical protein